MKTAWMFLGMFGVLIVAAVLLPSNSLTGHIVQSGTCEGIGCLKLCDEDTSVDTCGRGTVCCPTHWSSGVCDYDVNCEKIREFSLYQTLEVYNDTIRQQPEQIHVGSNFFMIILIVFGILSYFMFKRRSQDK